MTQIAIKTYLHWLSIRGSVSVLEWALATEDTSTHWNRHARIALEDGDRTLYLCRMGVRNKRTGNYVMDVHDGTGTRFILTGVSPDARLTFEGYVD